MTIAEYIHSKVRVSLTDENIQAILLDRGVASGATDAALFSLQMRELLYADALMLVATSPSSKGSETHEHGGFTQKTASETIKNAGHFEQIAMNIYRKWNDDRGNGAGELIWVDNEH